MGRSRIVCTALGLFLLVGCAGQTSAPTQTTAPASTPLPALTAETLQPLLYQPDDLPWAFVEQLDMDEFGARPPDPVADLIVHTIFHVEGAREGSQTIVQTAIYVYDDQSKVLPQHREADVFMRLAETHEDGKVIQLPDLGEDAIGMGHSLRRGDQTRPQFTEILFTRCRARVYMRFNHLDNLPVLEAYARRLDARIRPIVCQETA